MSADLPLTVNQVREQLPAPPGAPPRVHRHRYTVDHFRISRPKRRANQLRATRCGSRRLIHQADLDEFFTGSPVKS